MYHDSEDIIGKWWVNISIATRSYVSYIHRFKRTGKRNDIFLATKFGATSDPGRIINGSPAYVKESLERSLKRLGVDFVDLFYLHRPDQTVPIEVCMPLECLNVHSYSASSQHTVGAMADLVKRVSVFGLNALDWCPDFAVQQSRQSEILGSM